MTEPLLSTVEVPAKGAARASVVWLHGLGADGHDFEPVVPELGVDDLGVRFVFPHAPVRPVTLNGGMPMRAWYDILGLDLKRREDEAGVLDSTARVARLIAREVERGIPAERIAVAGFSQGGAIALHLGLRYGERLAGIVALSTWLPRTDTLDKEAAEANRKTPVFVAHGTMDPMVPVERGRAARLALEQRGYDVVYAEYPMQHQVCMEEIQAIGAFLRRVLS